MITYVKVFVSADGASPKEIIRRMKELGFKPLMGEDDFVIEWEKGDTKKYSALIEKMHQSLNGTGARYTLITEKD